MKRKVLRGWRFQEINEGMYVFFDPLVERVSIYPLTSSERSAMVKKCDSGDAVAPCDERSVQNKQRELPGGAPHL